MIKNVTRRKEGREEGEKHVHGETLRCAWKNNHNKIIQTKKILDKYENFVQTISALR